MRRLEPEGQTPAAPAPFQLREMVAADIEEVMRVEKAAFAHPWSAELFRRELEHDWSCILLAEEPQPADPQLLGFVIFWLVHDEIHILNVATDPQQRRRGVAKTLLRECFARGRTKGAQLATLEVRRSNVHAIDLYKSLGFRSVGVRPNYYSEEGEDAIVMTLDF